MNSRRLHTTILATALAAAALLGFAARHLGPAPACASAVEPAGVLAQVSAQPTQPELAAAPAHSRAPVPLESPAAASRTVASVPAAATRKTRLDLARESAGRLRVRAVDAETGAPLAQVRLRALNASRIADRDGGVGQGDLELALTPGAYSFLVLSNGYEPAVSSVGLARGEAFETTIALRGGSSRVEGRVRGSLPPDDAMRVELVGKGRRPCPSCSDKRASRAGEPASDRTAWNRRAPCRTCGYTSSASIARLGADGTFAFERLASGDYAVRLADGEGRTVGQPRALVLREAESARIELQSAAQRFVEVEFVDTDGSSLAGDWARRVAAREPPSDPPESLPAERTLVPSYRWKCNFRDAARCVARAEFETPLRGGCTVLAYGVSRCCGLGRSRSGLDDHERDGTETLHPAAVVPEFAPDWLECEIDARGLARFGPLPPGALTLDAQCADYAVSVAVPATTANSRVRALVTAVRGEPGEPSETAGEVDAPVDIPATFRAVEALRYP